MSDREEAIEVLEKGREDWEFLTDEEKIGTLHDALYLLK